MERKNRTGLMGLLTLILALLIASCTPEPEIQIVEPEVPPHIEEGSVLIDTILFQPVSLPGGKLNVKLITTEGKIEKTFTLDEKKRQLFRIDNVHEGKLEIKAELSDTMGTVLVRKDASIWMIGGGEEYFGLVLSQVEKATVTWKGTPSDVSDEAVWILEVSKSGEEPFYIANGRSGSDASFTAVLPVGTWNWQIRSVNEKSGVESVTGGTVELKSGINDDIEFKLPDGTGTLSAFVSGYDPSWDAVLKLQGPNGEALEKKIDESGNASFDSIAAGHWTIAAESFLDGELYGSATEEVDVMRDRNNPVWLNMVFKRTSISVTLPDEDIASIPSASKFEVILSGGSGELSFPVFSDGNHSVVFRNLAPGSYDLRVDAVYPDGSTLTVASDAATLKFADEARTLHLVSNPVKLTVDVDNGGRTNSYDWEIVLTPHSTGIPQKKTQTAVVPEFVFEALSIGRYDVELRALGENGVVLAYKSQDIVVEAGNDQTVVIAPEFSYDYATLRVKMTDDYSNPASDAVRSGLITVRSLDGIEYGSKSVLPGRYAEFRIPNGRYSIEGIFRDSDGRIIAEATVPELVCPAGNRIEEILTPVYEKSTVTVKAPTLSGGWTISLENRDTGMVVTLPETLPDAADAVAEVWPGNWIIKAVKTGEPLFITTETIEKGESTVVFASPEKLVDITVQPVVADAAKLEYSAPWTIRLIDSNGKKYVKEIASIGDVVFSGIPEGKVIVGISNSNGSADGWNEAVVSDNASLQVNVERKTGNGEIRLIRSDAWGNAASVRMMLSSSDTGESMTESFPVTASDAVWKIDVLPYGTWSLEIELLDAEGNVTRTKTDSLFIPSEKNSSYSFKPDYNSNNTKDRFVLSVIWNDPESILPVPDEYEINGVRYPAGKDMVLWDEFDELMVKALNSGVVISEDYFAVRWNGWETEYKSVTLSPSVKIAVEVLIPEIQDAPFIWDEATITMTGYDESFKLDIVKEETARMSYVFENVPRDSYQIEAVFRNNGYPVKNGTVKISADKGKDYVVELRLVDSLAKVSVVPDKTGVDGEADIYFKTDNWGIPDGSTIYELTLPYGVNEVEYDVLGEQRVLIYTSTVTLDVKENGQVFTLPISTDGYQNSYIRIDHGESERPCKLWYSSDGMEWKEMHQKFYFADFRSVPGQAYTVKGEMYDAKGYVLNEIYEENIQGGNGVTNYRFYWKDAFRPIKIVPEISDKSLLNDVVDWVIGGKGFGHEQEWRIRNDNTGSIGIDIRMEKWDLSVSAYDINGILIAKGTTSTENGKDCTVQLEKPISEVALEVVSVSGAEIPENRTLVISRENGEVVDTFIWAGTERQHTLSMPNGTYRFSFLASSADGTKTASTSGRLEVGNDSEVRIVLK